MPAKCKAGEVSAALQGWGPRCALAPELQILSKAETELARQVSLHCMERGVLLERIAKRRSDLLDVRRGCFLHVDVQTWFL